MDCETYYTQLLENFEKERELILNYSNLIPSSKSELHQLSWNEK